jgi:para-nitrobenzyl esterase
MTYMNRRSFLESSSLAAAGLVSGVFVRGAFAQDVRGTTVSPVVQTTAGRLRGLTRNGIHQFWGVPYGASTAGPGRFMPPVKRAAWTGVRECTQVSERAPQDENGPLSEFDALDRWEPMGEDCLTINVFTPGTGRGNRPVMFWMHGGGYSDASGNALLYDGSNLARKEDVVIVSVNHRLNLFGFLYLADLGGAKWANSGNVGMQDLVLALEWDPRQHRGVRRQRGKRHDLRAVRRRRQGHGVDGDAFGQGTLPPRDRAERFDAARRDARERDEECRAVHRPPRYHAESTRRAADEIVEGAAAGILQAACDPRARQRSGSGRQVIAARSLVSECARRLRRRAADAGIRRDRRRVDRARATARDRRSRDAHADHADRWAATKHARADLVALYRKTHPGITTTDVWLIMNADNSRRANAQTLGELKFAQGKAASYLYYFNWRSPVHHGQIKSFHTLDIPFSWYNVDIAASMTGAGNERYALAHKMSAAWAAFARSGNPNHPDLPNWPAFNPTSYPTMILGNDCRVVNDPNREERLALKGGSERTRPTESR